MLSSLFQRRISSDVTGIYVIQTRVTYNGCLCLCFCYTFEFCQDYVKRQTRFVSRKPAKVIISSIEAVAEWMGMKVHARNYKVSSPFNLMPN